MLGRNRSDMIELLTEYPTQQVHVGTALTDSMSTAGGGGTIAERGRLLLDLVVLSDRFTSSAQLLLDLRPSLLERPRCVVGLASCSSQHFGVRAVCGNALLLKGLQGSFCSGHCLLMRFLGIECLALIGTVEKRRLRVGNRSEVARRERASGELLGLLTTRDRCSPSFNRFLMVIAHIAELRDHLVTFFERCRIDTCRRSGSLLDAPCCFRDDLLQTSLCPRERRQRVGQRSETLFVGRAFRDEFASAFDSCSGLITHLGCSLEACGRQSAASLSASGAERSHRRSEVGLEPASPRCLRLLEILLHRLQHHFVADDAIPVRQRHQQGVGVFRRATDSDTAHQQPETWAAMRGASLCR